LLALTKTKEKLKDKLKDKDFLAKRSLAKKQSKEYAPDLSPVSSIGGRVSR
jgi:hypothetical protein